MNHPNSNITNPALITTAQILLPTDQPADDLAFFQDVLGFKLNNIYPADDPAVMILSGYGLQLRLERGVTVAPCTLQLLCDQPVDFANGTTRFKAPNGCTIDVVQSSAPKSQPATEHAFIVRRLRDETPWVIGRAGMHYRDLLPGRLGGAIIASHIRIPNGGPVPDMVHYHSVGFQLIFCINGWVRLVYEDQGPPFILEAGDCVTQPPEIRHRVLESSDNLEVIEIGVPAQHETTIDHQMDLPTKSVNPNRLFGGQTFCHSKSAHANWQPWRLPGFEARHTDIDSATRNIANVVVAQACSDSSKAPQSGYSCHSSDILINYVLAGSMTLESRTNGIHDVTAGDAFAIPPGVDTRYCHCSNQLKLLEISLPGKFQTTFRD